MRGMKKLLVVLFLILIDLVSAVRVGVVVEFPNGGIFKRCVTVDKGENAYEILKESGLKIEWSYDERFGHALCAILDMGCPAENCFCSSSYWNFYIKGIHDDSWKYSSVGFDAPGDCSNHYCAENGDLLGFTYSPYNKKPGEFSFHEICPETTTTIMSVGEKKTEKPDIIGEVIDFPRENSNLIFAAIVIILLVAYFLYKPWQYF